MNGTYKFQWMTLINIDEASYSFHHLVEIAKSLSKLLNDFCMDNPMCMFCFYKEKKLSLSSFDFATTYLLLWKLHYNLPKRFSQPCLSLTLLLSSSCKSKIFAKTIKRKAFISNCIDFPVLPYTFSRSWW